MKNNLAFIAAIAAFLSYSAAAASYSTEATITPLADKGQYRVEVRVSRLIQRDGKIVEELISGPRILSGLGCPASLYVGLKPENPDYRSQDNVSVDVSWPYPKESGLAFCTVIVKHGDEVVSRSKLQLQVTGPGRVPLVLSPQTVDPKSVSVKFDKSKSIAFVLLKFRGKKEEDAREIAIENLGNQVKIQDSGGHFVESGTISGTYEEIGLALQYNSEDEARQVASILEGAPAK